MQHRYNSILPCFNTAERLSKNNMVNMTDRQNTYSTAEQAQKQAGSTH